MKIQRTIPPSAAPIYWKDIRHGLIGLFGGEAYIERFENEIKEYFGVRHAFLVSSGKAALTIILQALKSLSPGRNKVIIPAYTCFSVPSAIVKSGLKVSLCDIDESTLDFKYELLESIMNEETLCVIPTHLFSSPSDMERINNLCRERDIFVVEDAAQAMGGKYGEKMLGTIGDAGFFSLGRGKNITCGSGGIIMTNSGRIADVLAGCYNVLPYPGLIEDLKNFFQLVFMSVFVHPSLYWIPARLPFLKLGHTIFHKDFPIKKMSSMKTGFLRDWKYMLEGANQRRKETAAFFNERLLSGNSRKESIPYLRLPVFAHDRAMRDRICASSKEQGLGLSLMYPGAIDEIKEIKGDFDGNVFPSASRIAECLFTVPTHHLLSEKDKENICASVAKELKNIKLD
jgi:perosamine synthetase